MARSEALGRVKAGYTTGVRRIAARSMSGLARSRVTPNTLTAGGVLLCTAGAIVVYFEDHNELAAFWIGAALFIVGSILDILDGALAKAEILGLRGDVGLGSRAERVVVISAGLILAPWGALQWAIYLLALTAWLTVIQRLLHVRRQLER